MRYPGAQTDMRLSEGEEWKTPVDPRGVRFEDWWTGEKRHAPDNHLTDPLEHALREAAEQAWNAAAKHFATLRRVGWLDQKGRVWTKIPPAAGFDGGSLTPLLIDARD